MNEFLRVFPCACWRKVHQTKAWQPQYWLSLGFFCFFCIVGTRASVDAFYLDLVTTQELSYQTVNGMVHVSYPECVLYIWTKHASTSKYSVCLLVACLSLWWTCIFALELFPSLFNTWVNWIHITDLILTGYIVSHFEWYPFSKCIFKKKKKNKKEKENSE